MIQINETQALNYVKGLIREAVEYNDGEPIELEYGNVDDLHDITIESEEVDAVYYTLSAILPSIVDDAMDYLNDLQDGMHGEYDVTYAMREGIGLCD